MNPYQAPESDLGNEAPQPKSKKGWKVFFWFLVIFHVFIIATTFLVPSDDYEMVDYFIDLVVYPVIMVGIFGFAYDKQIITSVFWKVWIGVALICDTYSLAEVFDTETLDYEGMELYAFLAVLLAILLPILILQYICLYGYAYKSPEIWNKKP